MKRQQHRMQMQGTVQVGKHSQNVDALSPHIVNQLVCQDPY